jgi:hypothetical protein
MLQQKELLAPKASVESDVKFGLRLIRELPTTWLALEPGELRVLLGLLFPENIRYQRPGFKTENLSCIYAVESTNSDTKNRNVTPTMWDSKPIMEQLRAINKAASKFASLQRRGLISTEHRQEALPSRDLKPS